MSEAVCCLQSPRFRDRLSRAWWLLAPALVLLAQSVAAAPFDWNLPLGFPTPKVSTDNPPTAEKVALGRFLFYDPRLSGNLTQSCGTCHRQALAFTDGLTRGFGSTGDTHPRNSMSLVNAAYPSTLAWANPNLTTLEKQVLLPMFGEHPVELGLSGKDEELIDRLRSDARYRRLFAEAFAGEVDPINLNNLVHALTTFVRTIVSGNAPYDRFVQGLDDNALSPGAQRAGRLFFSDSQPLLECFHCHGGFNFSVSVTFAGKPFDETLFQNNGLYNIGGTGDYPPDNPGIFEFTRIPEDMGSFKAPTLRNIEVTAPYMHDGSIATLEEVLDHYEAGGRAIVDGPYAGDGRRNRFKSNFVGGFALTTQQREDVLDLLKSLTDEEFLTTPRLGDPFTDDSCAADCNLDRGVTPGELTRAIDLALERATLAGCVAGDRDDDGAVTIEELTAAVVRLSDGCPAPMIDDNFVIGATADTGALSVTSGLTRQLTLPFAECVDGSGPDCNGGTLVFRLSGPGFEALTQPARRLLPVRPGAVLALSIHTTIARGVTIKLGDVTLSALGDTVVLGTTPEFQRDAEWQLALPADKPLPHNVSVWFKLHTEPEDSRASQPIAVILKPQLAGRAPSK